MKILTQKTDSDCAPIYHQGVCVGDGSGVGDSAVPKGRGMSVLAGWLGRPWARGVFSSVLSQGGRGWTKLLSDVEKSFL